jgi:hypothetical protein
MRELVKEESEGKKHGGAAKGRTYRVLHGIGLGFGG